MYLLDTNVLSELRKSKRGTIDSNVALWARQQQPDHVFISAITLLEIERGVLLMERRDRRQGELLRTWLENSVLKTFANRILPFDAVIAVRCAKLHVPDLRPEGDAMIAATALVHGYTLVTRNTADFQRMKVRLLNPWLPLLKH